MSLCTFVCQRPVCLSQTCLSVTYRLSITRLVCLSWPVCGWWTRWCCDMSCSGAAYQIQYRQLSIGTCGSVSSSGTQYSLRGQVTHITLDNLEPWSSYNVSVISSNFLGVTQSSLIVSKRRWGGIADQVHSICWHWSTSQVNTSASLPSVETPFTQHAQSDNDETVTLSWNKPACQLLNGALIGYEYVVTSQG